MLDGDNWTSVCFAGSRTMLWLLLGFVCEYVMVTESRTRRTSMSLYEGALWDNGEAVVAAMRSVDSRKMRGSKRI